MKPSLRIFLLLLAMSMTTLLHAQTIATIRQPKDKAMGVFTEWEKKTVEFEDKTTAEVEYRIALATRKGIGCHYDIEVKNNSDQKIIIKLDSNYYDKLVKSHFGDKIEVTLKPGKSLVGRMVAQGCKKVKDRELDDFETCMECDFFVDLLVSK